MALAEALQLEGSETLRERRHKGARTDRNRRTTGSGWTLHCLRFKPR